MPNVSSQSIYLGWLTTPGNYDKWNSATKKRLDSANVIHKIGHIETSLKNPLIGYRQQEQCQK